MARDAIIGFRRGPPKIYKTPAEIGIPTML
jgi:hypothetical protein